MLALRCKVGTDELMRMARMVREEGRWGGEMIFNIHDSALLQICEDVTLEVRR